MLDSFYPIDGNEKIEFFIKKVLFFPKRIFLISVKIDQFCFI